MSYCVNGGGETYYNYYPPLVAKFNVTSTSSATQIVSNPTIFSEIEVDGVVLPSTAITTYQFDTTGEHTVKYKLADVTNIGIGAFSGCYNLTNITIPDSVKSIGQSAFNNCTGLTNITIPDGVTSLGESAFYFCGKLTGATVGNGVTIFRSNVFAGCSALTTVIIGNEVTTLNNYIFSGCSSLSTIRCYTEIAPVVTSHTFISVKTNGRLYVPIGNKNYDRTWLQNANYYLGKYSWRKVSFQI